jgi:hypothetical protein
MNRDVAVKVLNAGFSSEIERRTFERECHALGRLSHHPNIVTVFNDAMTTDGRPCIVMELYHSNYRERLEHDGVLAIDEAIAVAVRICGALQTAHEAGVLHRDLKPHNIFVSAYGEPALGDFGISTIDDERSQSRSSGLSIAYAAPEVLEDGDASVASDIYSTAIAVAYGGRYGLYARGDEPGILSIRSVPDDREKLRIATTGILGSYLYFSPDDRFLLGLEDGYALRVWRVADGRAMLPGDLRGCRAHAFSMDGRQLAVGWQDWILCFDLATGREVRRWRIAGTAHTLAFHPDHRQLAVGYLNRGVASVYDAANGKLVADLEVGAIQNQVVAWHPQGERLAVTGSDPRIQIWSVAVKDKLAVLDGHRQHVQRLTFHPSGQLLASRGWDGMLLLWDPFTGRQLMRLTSVNDPQFSVDGRWLGVAWHENRADLLEVALNRENRTLSSNAVSGVCNASSIVRFSLRIPGAGVPQCGHRFHESSINFPQ